MMAEVAHAGDWLFLELTKKGCDEDLARSICFAAGQRMALRERGESVMDLCRTVVERWEAGDWDVPGPPLADKLFKEKFGSPPNVDKLDQWLREWLADQALTSPPLRTDR